MSPSLVLLADDDEDSRLAIQYALEDDGYAVEVVENGLQVLERLKTPPTPALLLLDIRMPLMDGVTLVHALEAGDFPRVDIVLLTALPHAEGIDCPLLRKPVSLETLLQVVAEHTGRAPLGAPRTSPFA
ncbi:MAG TPA: response regulator [Polyangiaceae bacterium]|jgi:CheY-like chemotaxis protein